MDLILYNPKSKNSRANVQTHRLVKKYKKKNLPFRLKSLLKIDDISIFLKENPQYKKVILLGGDGTINHLINTLAESDINIPIYIKKNGSGNDFLRTLKRDDKNQQHIMKANLDNGTSHYFINGTGIGLDGLIIDYVDKAKSKGKLSYFISSFRAMINYVPEDLKVVIDDKVHHFQKAYLATINNGRFIGGGMQITPKARIDEPDLDVIIVHKIPKFLILLIFSTIYLGIHTKFKRYVYYTKCKQIDVHFSTPQIMQSDGEKNEDITSMSVEVSSYKANLKAY